MHQILYIYKDIKASVTELNYMRLTQETNTITCSENSKFNIAHFIDGSLTMQKYN